MIKALRDKHIVNDTKIKNISFKIGMLLLTFSFLIPGSFAADVTLPNKIITTGQSFDMNVTFDPKGTSIAGAQLDLAFNRSILRINRITEGNLFKQKGDTTFFNGGIINNPSGTVVNIFDAIIGKSSISNPGTFIIINMTAIGSIGTSRINMSNVKISDPNGNPVALNVINGTVSINSSPVVHINSPPLLTAIGNKIVNEGQALNFSLSAVDPDGSTLIFSALNLPAGAIFNPVTRNFRWTPGYDQSGTYPKVHFEVFDGQYKVFENITITVNDVNRAPTLTLTPANGSKFNESDLITITIAANDPDKDPLTYFIKIDGKQVTTSLSYTWKTNYRSAGYHNIEASVTDGKATVNLNNTIYINNIHPRHDVNKNGIVDIADLVITGQHFKENTGINYPSYDVNKDGVVDIADITIIAQNFGELT